MNDYYSYNTVNYDTNKDNPATGFERGNLFDNLYEPYKNYKPATLKPNNEEDYLMYQIQMYSFALNDLNLYLDIHPNDREKINLRCKYLKDYQDAFNQYENKYGALGVNSTVLNKTPWSWNTSFSWEDNK